jgi:hypothetical protein
VLRVDDHAGARGDLRLAAARHAEEAPEEGIAQQRVVLLGASLQHGDVHDGRRHLLQHRGERRQAVALRRRGELRERGPAQSEREQD